MAIVSAGHHGGQPRAAVDVWPWRSYLQGTMAAMLFMLRGIYWR